jgi:hypothetical protein
MARNALGNHTTRVKEDKFACKCKIFKHSLLGTSSALEHTEHICSE